MSILRHTPADEPWFLVRTTISRGRRGHSVVPHAHRWPQLLVTVRGVLTVWTEVGSWVVPPRSAVWAPAGIRHGLRYSGDVELHALWFRPDNTLTDLPRETGVVAVSPFLAALIARSIAIGMLDERIETHRALALLISDSIAASAVPPFELPMPHTPELLQLVQLAEASHYTLSSRELAGRCAMSARTLERRFASDAGVSLGRWMRHARMIESLRQLASGTPLKTVAHQVGYHTASAFAFAFRQQFGVSPGQYFTAFMPNAL
jgi:AraC-like DNA-binding protein